MENLSPNAKFVYGIIDSLDNEDGCYASNGYLAKSLGVSDRQVRNLLGELEDAKLIIRVSFMKNGTEHRIIRSVEKVALLGALGNKLPTPRKNTSTPLGNKLPTDNKEDNKEDKDTGSWDKKGLIEQLDKIPWVEGLPFSSEAFSKAWQSWIDYRKQIKKPIKEATMKAQWEEFKKWGEDKAIYAIQEAIKQGWSGIYEPKKNVNKFSAKPLTPEDHETF